MTNEEHESKNLPLINEDYEEKDIKSKFTFNPVAAKSSFHMAPCLIIPYLFSGTQHSASSYYIKEFNIKRILNLKEFHYSESPKDILYLHKPMSDYGETDIFDIGEECFKFIHDGRTMSENVLVHCRGGINRSMAMIIAYLMIKENYSLFEAYNHVKGKNKVQLHIKYLEQLKIYEKKTIGVITLEDYNMDLSLKERIEIYRENFKKK